MLAQIFLQTDGTSCYVVQDTRPVLKTCSLEARGPRPVNSPTATYLWNFSADNLGVHSKSRDQSKSCDSSDLWCEHLLDVASRNNYLVSERDRCLYSRRQYLWRRGRSRGCFGLGGGVDLYGFGHARSGSERNSNHFDCVGERRLV